MLVSQIVMNVIFKHHESRGTLLKSCFVLKLKTEGKLLRPFDHFILNVFESHMIVSCWSLPLEGALSGNYDISNKKVFGKILNCKVINSDLIFITSDSGTISIIRVIATGFQATNHGFRVSEAIFELVFQQAILGLRTDYNQLGFLLAVDLR